MKNQRHLDEDIHCCHLPHKLIIHLNIQRNLFIRKIGIHDCAISFE